MKKKFTILFSAFLIASASGFSQPLAPYGIDDQIIRMAAFNSI